MPNKVAPPDRVPIKSKLAYGAAGAVDNISINLPGQLAAPIFSTGLGLSPALISIAVLVFRLYDAILDPFLGWISDNTRSRFGRRKPYIFVGAILLGFWFPVMWLAGRHWGQYELMGWLIGTGLVFYTFFSIWSMPYQSMLLEMTPDYNERTNVSSYRSFFQALAGLVLGWAWYLTQLPIFADKITGKPDSIVGARALTSVTGILVIALGVLPAFFVVERYYKQAINQKRISLQDNFRWTFANRPFVIVALFTIVFAGGTSLCTGFSYYLRLYYVTGGNQGLAAKIQGTESTLMVLMSLVSIPFFNWLCQLVGKTRGLMVAIGMAFFGLVTQWWTYTPLYPWLSIVNGVLLAPAYTGLWQIVPSINGDVVDYDELQTGERREGAFASIFSWIVKASYSLGFGLSGPLIVGVGFDVSKTYAQSQETFIAMRLLYSLAPAIISAIALGVLFFYPLSPVVMQNIRADLEARRGKV